MACFGGFTKLEQPIQRTSNRQGVIVGQTRIFVVVVELELIFHEILLVQNNSRKRTNDRMMEHHTTIMYQELNIIKDVICYANVSPVFLTLCEL